MKKETKKTEYATKKDLEDILTEQTGVILSAMESRFDGMDKGLDKKLDGLRHELYLVRNELKEEMQSSKNELKHNINNV
jgi:hypothetical protein